MLGLGNSLGKQSTPLSSAPVGFDKTFSFDSDLEGWAVYTGVGTHIASYTPSSDSEKTGIVQMASNGTSFSPSISLDFSTLSDFDNSLPLYYSIVFSVSSSSDFTGIRQVLYGTGGSTSSHSAATSDEWVEITGALASVGSSDDIVVYTGPSSGVTVGHVMHIDSMRFSHTDFR